LVGAAGAEHAVQLIAEPLQLLPAPHVRLTGVPQKPTLQSHEYTATPAVVAGVWRAFDAAGGMHCKQLPPPDTK
jgi:hypothetical protein